MKWVGTIKVTTWHRVEVDAINKDRARQLLEREDIALGEAAQYERKIESCFPLSNSYIRTMTDAAEARRGFLEHGKNVEDD